MKLGYKVFTTLFILFSVLPTSNVAAEQVEQKLLITEVKTGGSVTGQPTEYVEVRNVYHDSVDLSGSLLEYAKPSANITECNTDWSVQDASGSVKVVELAGVLEPGTGLIVEISMNDNTGGSLKLSKATQVFDVVGWGNSVTPGVCKEGELAPIPEKGRSIKRYTSLQAAFIDTNDNYQDFSANQLPLNGSYPIKDEEPAEIDICNNIEGVQVVPPYGYSMDNGVCEPVSPEEQNTPCQGVVLSEIVPNPTGVDTGAEYVELYNKTNTAVSLEGCILRVGGSNKALTGILEPGYKAFYGLVLPNAAGGTVELITPTTEEVATYPGDLKDDEAWALIDGTWQLTAQPTPNEPNVLVSVVEAVASTDTSDKLGSCPAGKFRNPETNRCKKIEAESDLKPCAADQVRNPDTNRCKKVASLTSSLKPCDPGQERNPATNRCRKVSSDDSSLKPCKEGQERNPDTNRCRKVAGVATDSPVEDVSPSSSVVNYVLIALFAGTVMLYALYEYRDSLGNYIARLRLRGKK